MITPHTRDLRRSRHASRQILVFTEIKPRSLTELAATGYSMQTSEVALPSTPRCGLRDRIN